MNTITRNVAHLLLGCCTHERDHLFLKRFPLSGWSDQTTNVFIDVFIVGWSDVITVYL